MKDSFIKARNIPYDRFVFFSFRRQKGESVENFYGRLIERAQNCSLGDEKTTLIRDSFILNMQDHDTQRELLKEAGSPAKALEFAMQMEMEAQNQQKNQNMNTNAQSVNIFNNFQGRNWNASYQ